MPDEIIDPLLNMPVTVQKVQPFQALKQYVCPGCSHEIMPGVGHMVVVPIDAAELRRHWHNGCWENRHRSRNRRR